MKSVIVKTITLSCLLMTTLAGWSQNYCLNFSGSDDYVTINSNFGLGTGAHSIECWVFIPTTSEKGTFVNVGDAGTGYAIGVGGTTFDDLGNKLIVIFNLKQWYATTTDIGTGWHHVAYTYNGSTSMLVYLDGKLVDTKTVVAPFSPNNAACIGATVSTNRLLTTGKIDEVRIWSEARSEANLKTYMHKELAGNETNLAAYYKMSDGSGTTLTSNKSSGGTNGTITNATWQASGNFSGPRQALDFDGTNDYVSSAITFSSATAITLEGWIYPRTFNPVGDAYISNIAGYDGASCLLRIGDNSGELAANDRLQFVINSTNKLSSATQLSANTWYHVAAVFDGTNMYLYINGVLDCSKSITSATVTSTGNFILGGQTNGARMLDGQLDEFRIWTSARTSIQIRENMMNTLAGNESGLAAYYRFDQVDGSTLYDITSNAKNGTLTNMDPATDWVSSSAFNTWIGGESSTWSAAANWSRNAAAGSTDNAGLYKNTIGSHPAISGSPTVNHLLVSSASYPTKSSGMTVNGNMLLNVDFDLTTYTLTLGSSARLDEGSYRVTGTSGTITTTRSLSNISAQNVGGMGAAITTSANMGSTTITRGFAAQTQGSGSSILRYFDITPTTNTGLNATLVFNYNDNELNSLTEANLRLYKSTNLGTTWTDMGGTLSTSANTITLTGQDGFSRWTAGDAGMSCTNPTSGGTIAASQSIFSGQTPAAFTSSAVASGNNGTLEYKWQQSTTSSGSGFSDIASSNSTTYAPGALVTTTWYKRLARVTCKSDWTGAAESNVLTVTVNSVTPATGVTTFDLSFNGTDNYVDCGNFSVTGWSTITLSAWVRYNGSGISGDIDLAGKTRGARISVNSSGKAVFNVYTGEGDRTVTSAATVNLGDGNWHHVAGVYDRYATPPLKVYADGIVTSSTPLFYDNLDGSNYNLTIGGNPYTPSSYWNGEIDEVQIWNTARTEAEIKANMYKEAGTNSNLKAYYKMSDGMGTSLTDNSGNGNTGTLTNSPTWKTSGCFSGPRQALDFDGSNDYVAIPANAAYNTTNFTVEFWVKANNPQAGNYRGIVDKGRYTASHDWYFLTGLAYSQVIFGMYGIGEVWFGTDANWHHIAGTYDGTNLRGYIDGALDNDTYTGTRPAPSTNGINVGGTQINSDYFNGRIEELRIWNTARTAEEIRENMFRPLAGNETGLVGYFRFDCKDGTTLYDLTSTANNGTLTNMDGSTDWVASTAYNTWIGSESTAWSTAKNWSSGAAPVSTDNVGIYKWNDLSFENTLSGSPSVNSILFSSTATPTVSSQFTATGSVCQNKDMTLYGDGSVTNTISNYLISSGKTLTIPYNGKLTMNSALVNEGTLMIQSTASGTGSLIQSTSGVTATVQRYLSANVWHLITSPVSGQSIPSLVTVPPFAKNGVKYGLAPYDNSIPNWVHYTESTLAGAGNFTVAKGYEALLTTDATLSFTGTLASGATTIGVTTGSNKWNLIGNPFTAAVCANSNAQATNNFLDVNTSAFFETGYMAVYIWDPGISDYNVINNASAATYIQLGQSFFVKIAAAGNASFTAAMRTHQPTATFYKSSQSAWPMIDLRADISGKISSAKIYFIPDATPGVDAGYDASIFTAGNAEKIIYTHIDDSDIGFAIQSLPPDSIDNSVIPVGMNAPGGSMVVFSAEVSDLPGGTMVYIWDKELKIYTRLDLPGSAYTVILTSASKGIGRFFLITTPQVVVNNEQVKDDGYTIIPLPQHDKIRIIRNITHPTPVALYDLSGRIVASVTLYNGTENEIQVQHSSNGLYLLVIYDKTGLIKRKICWLKY